jgi:phage protein D
MGYGANLVTMLKGSFTTMLPTFADTAPTLKVTALNVLHELRRSQYTTTWENKRDSDIALDISKRLDNGRKRFPLPVAIDDHALNTEKPIPKVSQQNQYDIDFLFERAKKRGYVVFVQEAARHLVQCSSPRPRGTASNRLRSAHSRSESAFTTCSNPMGKRLSTH